MESVKKATDDGCSYCNNLPKIVSIYLHHIKHKTKLHMYFIKQELHAHLNGSLSSNTLRALGCSETSMAKYQELNTILEKTERTLDECFQLFRVAHELTKTKEAVYLATESVIKEFADDNVIYLELRTTPREEMKMTKEEYIESVVQAILDCKLEIIVKLLCSIDRRHSLKASEESLEIIIKMKKKYPDIIKGLDLSGNPLEGSFPVGLFEKARKNGLFITLHCAEVKNDAEVLEMLKFQPNRLGHCTYLHPIYGGCESNWELYCNLKIPIGEKTAMCTG